MLNIFYGKVFIVVLALYCSNLIAQEEQLVGFSADFLALIAQQRELNTSNRINISPEKEKQPTTEWVTVDTLEASINPAAAIYMLIKIIALYKTVYSGVPTEQALDNSWLMAVQQRIVSLMYPTSLHNNARFIVGSCRIIIEVLIYKTLTQMLVLCLKGNIFDALEQSIARIASLAKRIIGLS